MRAECCWEWKRREAVKPPSVSRTKDGSGRDANSAFPVHPLLFAVFGLAALSFQLSMAGSARCECNQPARSSRGQSGQFPRASV
jgi:hypothetical protein